MYFHFSKYNWFSNYITTFKGQTITGDISSTPLAPCITNKLHQSAFRPIVKDLDHSNELPPLEHAMQTSATSNQDDTDDEVDVETMEEEEGSYCGQKKDTNQKSNLETISHPSMNIHDKPSVALHYWRPPRDIVSF